jgi:hypothetical protein
MYHRQVPLLRLSHLVQATFAYHMRSTGVEIAVFAGHMPLDRRVLNLVPTDVMSMYFASWTPTLLGVPSFAVTSSAPDCDENCTASFLPGGVANARKISQFLNSTLLEGGLFGNAETIQIRRAPGLLLRFVTLGTDFDFNRENECKLYGLSLNDAIQICIRQSNESLAVGWAACPTRLLGVGCRNDVSWTQKAMRKKIKVTAFKQFATTAYDRQDFSIINVEKNSEPIVQPLFAADFTATWEKVFSPKSGSSSTDIMMSNSLTYSLTWLLRLYDDSFPDDENTPLRHLQNFVSIPQQFMVTCVQFINYSAPFLTGFDMPRELETTVVSGTSTERFVGQVWTVWLFISASAVTMLGIGTVFLYVLMENTAMPRSTGLSELDFVSRLGRGDTGEAAISIKELVRDKGLSKCNAWKASKALRGLNIELSMQEVESGPELSLVVLERSYKSRSGNCRQLPACAQ